MKQQSTAPQGLPLPTQKLPEKLRRYAPTKRTKRRKREKSKNERKGEKKRKERENKYAPKMHP